MDWLYLYINEDGILVDARGFSVFTNCPSFDSIESAENWLTENDERANCVGYYANK